MLKSCLCLQTRTARFQRGKSIYEAAREKKHFLRYWLFLLLSFVTYSVHSGVVDQVILNSRNSEKAATSRAYSTLIKKGLECAAMSVDDIVFLSTTLVNQGLLIWAAADAIAINCVGAKGVRAAARLRGIGFRKLGGSDVMMAGAKARGYARNYMNGAKYQARRASKHYEYLLKKGTSGRYSSPKAYNKMYDNSIRAHIVGLRLEKSFRGHFGAVKKTLTALGKKRYVDGAVSRTLHEVKHLMPGNTLKFKKFLKEQMAKDGALYKAGHKVFWHIFRGKGKKGTKEVVSKKLLEQAQNLGIKVVIH